MPASGMLTGIDIVIRTTILKHSLHRIERIICHPVLLTIRRHRQSDTMQRRVALDKRTQTLGLEVLLSLHLDRQDVAATLNEEVEFTARIVS